MQDNLKRITIQAYKYGNRLHYEWETILLEQTDTYVLVLGEYGRKLKHHSKGKNFEVNNWTLEYFSFVDWFTVSGDIRHGKIYQYYCNINQPAKLVNDVVSFVDLDLDYVYRDGIWKVVDEDEFENHSIQFSYPLELINSARQELLQLQERIERKLYPFDGTLQRWIPKIQTRFVSKS
ncbi:DUF402 domain-containing protein [Cohnella sp.]|uniref:DUF402 domain-containing protein n=1 Tax=Cohnella sp. TaxID=1883426 RepID=UPI0035668DB9